MLLGDILPSAGKVWGKGCSVSKFRVKEAMTKDPTMMLFHTERLQARSIGELYKTRAASDFKDYVSTSIPIYIHKSCANQRSDSSQAPTLLLLRSLPWPQISSLS